MRCTILAATAALLSTCPVLAAPDADTLITGYERLMPIGEEFNDDVQRLDAFNAVVIAPRMLLNFAAVDSEFQKQADLVREGVEPLPDKDQKRACESFGELSELAGENFSMLLDKWRTIPALKGIEAFAAFGPAFTRWPRSWETMKDGFRQAAPNCAAETIENGPDVSGLLDTAIKEMTGSA